MYHEQFVVWNTKVAFWQTKDNTSSQCNIIFECIELLHLNLVMLHFSNSVGGIYFEINDWRIQLYTSGKGHNEQPKKGALFRNTAHHIFTSKGEKKKAHDWGLMNHMQNLLNNLSGKIKGAHERSIWKNQHCHFCSV